MANFLNISGSPTYIGPKGLILQFKNVIIL